MDDERDAGSGDQGKGVTHGDQPNEAGTATVEKSKAGAGPATAASAASSAGFIVFSVVVGVSMENSLANTKSERQANTKLCDKIISSCEFCDRPPGRSETGGAFFSRVCVGRVDL
ncbi:hypothetical protein [Duganella violaceipulchra]|uniref:Uncharacterized protein n=1 Tax=Duganella violaceipulchra TaxID=2849652 RepID=A0AA41L3N5_9BURK|nr:hypothetical protein [Duganella violaceicalia]MBV6321954.1 hypothetical protein [Duganella violaceicalia]MCP2007051.1 hypothetical protein [Duganella violaceicalia]